MTAPSSVHREHSAGARGAALPLIETLEQLAVVVEGLDDERYGGATGAASNGSVGAHVRHCLDHVEALLGALDSGTLDYDRRRRGSLIESDRGEALSSLRAAQVRLARLDEEAMARPIAVSMLLSPGSPQARFGSTLGREMAYVLSHTTHHNALIGYLVSAMGRPLPHRFGYAASTRAWLDAPASCAS